LDAEGPAESAIGRISIVEGALWRWREQFRGAVEPVQLDEDGAGLFGPAPPYRGKGPLDVAAANIGRHPDRGFEAHEGDYLDCRMSCSRSPPAREQAAAMQYPRFRQAARGGGPHFPRCLRDRPLSRPTTSRPTNPTAGW